MRSTRGFNQTKTQMEDKS